MKAHSITWRKFTYLDTEIIATELRFLQITNSKFHQLVHNSNYYRLCLLYYLCTKKKYLEKIKKKELNKLTTKLLIKTQPYKKKTN